MSARGDRVSRGERRARRKRRERGIALIMVMGAIAILTVMLAEFQDETSAELAAATAQRDGVQAEYMARSAVNLSRLLIASEPTMRKAISPLFMLMKRTPPQLPVWEFSDKLLGAFNDDDANQEFASTIGVDPNEGKNLKIMEGGHFELSIVDEDAKINVNLGAQNEIAHIRLAKEIMGLISQPQYAPLFDQRDDSGQYNNAVTTCRELIDWGDVDEQAFNCDLTQLSAAQNTGVEDAFYQLLPTPYRRKNAPYDSLEELHMVRGVSQDFWATFVDPEPDNPKKRVMTVWGQGKVNVNTANAQTLLGVVCAGAPTAPLCTNPEQASAFLTGVTMARGITMGAPLFGSTRDFVAAMTGKGQLGPLLAAIGMQPVVFQSNSDFQNSITTESKVFSIYAVGAKKGYRRETRVKIHAVVDFRNAPGLTAGGLGAAGALAGGANPLAGATNPLAGQAAAAAGANGANANALAAAMMPSTGGQFIYFRVE